MIKPSIGRVVLVYRGRAHLGLQWNEASIIYVHSDTMINVAGFDADGTQFKEMSLTLRQDDIASDATNLPPLEEAQTAFACWMPYQRKVAAVPVQTPQTA